MTVAAIFAACTPFSSSPDETKAVDAGPVESPDASADAGGGSDATLPPRASCRDAPAGNLFCDDFSSGSFDQWTYPETNPQIVDAPGAGFRVDSPSDAPSAPVAIFDFPQGTTNAGGCGYAWTRKLLDLTGAPLDKVTVAFDLRVVKFDPSGSKESVGIVIVKDSKGTGIENYVMIHDAEHANLYEQWSAASQHAPHTLGDLSRGNWVRFELTLDAKNHQGTVALDGIPSPGSPWTLGEMSFGTSIAKVMIGIGYTCSTVGGTVQYDNVLVTPN